MAPAARWTGSRASPAAGCGRWAARTGGGGGRGGGDGGWVVIGLLLLLARLVRLIVAAVKLAHPGRPRSWLTETGREAGSLGPAVQLAQCGELGRGGRLEHFQRIRHGELPAGLGRPLPTRH